MSDRDKIKALIDEAKLYQKQSLLNESREKYLEALNTIENSEHFRDDKKLIKAVNKRIQIIEKDLKEFGQLNETVELSPEMQDLILDLFSYSKNKDTAAMEGAVSLAKFGQYEQALAEFRKLMKEGPLPLLAAKNILRCHLNHGVPEEAIAEFKQWVCRGTFQKRYLKNLREFLVNMLGQRDIKADLPAIIETATEKAKRREIGDDVLDISLVTIELEDGPRKGDLMEFDVSFQTGNTVSFSIPADRQDLVEAFKPGTRLQNMQCYAILAVFNGSGIVSDKKRINSGPNQGDYALDITIDGGSSKGVQKQISSDKKLE